MFSRDFAKLEVMRNLIILLVGLFASLTSQAEIIEFKLQTEDQACKGLSQVVVSQDKMVLYHLEVPMYGTGQVHLLTGNYQIDAVNKEGCSFQDVIQISDLPNKLINVNLAKSARKTASTGMETSMGYANPAVFNPMSYNLWPSPWWGGWGYQQFNQNFYNPCGWSMYGCGGNYYPHGGNIAMGKPNIYLTGKDEGKFKLKFTGSSFNFLATVPSFKEKEITGELRKGSIYSDNTWYPYLFYDARVSDEHFQSTQGFCGTRKEIFKFMMEGLAKYEFPNQARTDFAEYWSVKIPEALKYCVYPQASAQLDKVAPLEFTFDDKSQIQTERLFYLVIPQDYKGKRIPTKENRFSDKPKNQWKHYSRTVVPKMPYLYEWGVGFMFE